MQTLLHMTTGGDRLLSTITVMEPFRGLGSCNLNRGLAKMGRCVIIPGRAGHDTEQVVWLGREPQHQGMGMER